MAEEEAGEGAATDISELAPSEGEAELELPDSEAAAFDRLLDLVAARPAEEAADAEAPIPERIEGLVIGRVVAVLPQPMVAWRGAPDGAAARSMARLDPSHVGREVAVLFESQDPSKPTIMGLMEPGLALPSAGSLHVERKGEKESVVLEAERELVLKCGKASITLTRAGKIIIRGTYVSSSATGVHRIRAGAVEIN